MKVTVFPTLVQSVLLLPLENVNFCFEKEMTLPLFDAAPEMLAAVYEHVSLSLALTTIVAVRLIGLDLLVPLIVAGLPLAALTVAL